MNLGMVSVSEYSTGAGIAPEGAFLLALISQITFVRYET